MRTALTLFVMLVILLAAVVVPCHSVSASGQESTSARYTIQPRWEFSETFAWNSLSVREDTVKTIINYGSYSDYYHGSDVYSDNGWLARFTMTYDTELGRGRIEHKRHLGYYLSWRNSANFELVKSLEVSDDFGHAGGLSLGSDLGIGYRFKGLHCVRLSLVRFMSMSGFSGSYGLCALHPGITLYLNMPQTAFFTGVRVEIGIPPTYFFGSKGRSVASDYSQEEEPLGTCLYDQTTIEKEFLEKSISFQFSFVF